MCYILLHYLLNVLLGHGFASPNSGRSSNTKNIINSLTKNRERPHPQPSINIPPFPVSLTSIQKKYSTFFLQMRIFCVYIDVFLQQPPDSSSNTSSCNSSTPSSPAIQPSHTPHSNLKPQFHFPGKRTLFRLFLHL